MEYYGLVGLDFINANGERVFCFCLMSKHGNKSLAIIDLVGDRLDRFLMESHLLERSKAILRLAKIHKLKSKPQTFGKL